MKTVLVLLLICLVDIISCRDFYFGMFEKNDFLVAADELYKPMSPSKITWAQYGKVFKCPITYFRIVDRLGSISNPRVEILKGGIQKKYVVVRLSVYNQPISVNIYVGCHNKNKNITRPRPTTKAHSTQDVAETSLKDGETVPDSTVAGPEDSGKDKPEKDDGKEPEKEENKDDKPKEEKKEEENKPEEEAKPEEEGGE